jgi:tetrahydromethanopterin S-methyltransferase subunit G
MTTTSECKVKHKQINWVLGILVTLIIGFWSIFIPLFLYLNSANAQNSEEISQIKIEKSILQDRYDTLLTKLDKMDNKIDKVQTTVIDLDKKISIHIGNNTKVASTNIPDEK